LACIFAKQALVARFAVLDEKKIYGEPQLVACLFGVTALVRPVLL